jgi:fumarate reductase flavoprotein subunit
MRRFISPAPEKVQMRNAGTGRGEGFRMVEAVGGHFAGRESGFYGHIMARESFTDERLSPYPFVDTLACAGMVVRRDGPALHRRGPRRDVRRQRDGALARSDGRGGGVRPRIWDGPGTKKALPPNPIFPLSGGRIIIADTIAELAAKAGIDVQWPHRDRRRAQRARAQRHDVVAAGAALGRQDQGIRARAAAVRRDLACPGITYTMGGIAIDGHARVLNDADLPIPGLYAAGRLPAASTADRIPATSAACRRRRRSACVAPSMPPPCSRARAHRDASQPCSASAHAKRA